MWFTSIFLSLHPPISLLLSLPISTEKISLDEDKKRKKERKEEGKNEWMKEKNTKPFRPAGSNSVKVPAILFLPYYFCIISTNVNTLKKQWHSSIILRFILTWQIPWKGLRTSRGLQPHLKNSVIKACLWSTYKERVY